jgi:Protein of unknown function (DUF3800)
MHYLFVDESGELGQAAGSSLHFLIAALCTENLKGLKNRLKKEKAKLYKDGWPRSIEIKGTNIWRSRLIPSVPKSITNRRTEILKEIISSICASKCMLHYSIAKKANLPQHILNAEYGIAYNFLCGALLCRAYPKYFCGPLHIFVDQRHKEIHSKLKFDGYLETKLVCECSHSMELQMQHRESRDIPGLQAVDFLSWGLFRSYEREDHTFKPLITPIVGHREDCYS